MKIRISNLFAGVFLIPLFSLLSCDYSPGSFPEKIISDYEIAFPLTDTSINIIDIPELSSITNPEAILNAGTRFFYQLSFPFYTYDFFNEGQIVEWVEPKALVNSTLGSSLSASFTKIYIKCIDGKQAVLGENIDLREGSNALFGNEASRIYYKDFLSLEYANRFNADMVFEITQDIKVKDLQLLNLQVNFGVKMRVRMGFSIN